MKNIKNLKLVKIDDEEEEEDDIFAPPLSPPPPHLIYFPETYAGTKSWQQVNTYIPQHTTIATEKKGYLIRRRIYTIAKTLIQTLFKNNNLLLMANIVNKLWKARASFIRPTLLIINNMIFIIRHDGYKKLIRYMLHFVHYNFNKQQQQRSVISSSSHVSPIHTSILLLATMSHFLVQFQKIAFKWSSNTIRNMGGLDSVILAVSAIIFAKSIQRTTRII